MPDAVANDAAGKHPPLELWQKLGRAGMLASRVPSGRGLHSSTSRLNASNLCGLRWVPSLDRQVMTRHKLNTKRLTDQNGFG